MKSGKRPRSEGEEELPLVSLITPMRNAQAFLPEMLESVLSQTYQGPMELCVYDDGSTDRSCAILEEWRAKLRDRNIALVITHSPPEAPAGGCGKGRNVAIGKCTGKFLCFLDADDVMTPERVETQLELAQADPQALVGARVWREGGATPRFPCVSLPGSARGRCSIEWGGMWRTIPTRRKT
mmetsp:Transcript_29976/g.65543  ORF Transcript_29976/g.65543 Transcript_29976/m.65543 type:complete len:182 (+) Transcript_29976:95-640(+)